MIRGQGIHQPGVGNSRRCVSGEFLQPIHWHRGGGKHLTHPIGSPGLIGPLQSLGKILHPPPRQIGDHHVLSQMKFGFVRKPPAPGSMETKAEGNARQGSQIGGRPGVGPCRSRKQVQPPAQNLGHLVLGSVKDILAGGAPQRAFLWMGREGGEGTHAGSMAPGETGVTFPESPSFEEFPGSMWRFVSKFFITCGTGAVHPPGECAILTSPSFLIRRIP